jgi:hypothetical protein
VFELHVSDEAFEIIIAADSLCASESAAVELAERCALEEIEAILVNPGWLDTIGDEPLIAVPVLTVN